MFFANVILCIRLIVFMLSVSVTTVFQLIVFHKVGLTYIFQTLSLFYRRNFVRYVVKLSAINHDMENFRIKNDGVIKKRIENEKRVIIMIAAIKCLSTELNVNWF